MTGIVDITIPPYRRQAGPSQLPQKPKNSATAD
jgi:hypothetical protein